MKDGPDIAAVASLVGDPARANMLMALLDGRARTATELADEASVTKQTASAHIRKLSEGQLIRREVQGRHHYFRLESPDVAVALEALLTVAAGQGASRFQPGPKEPALRYARVCYDHLAGERGVAAYDQFLANGWMIDRAGEIDLTIAGAAAFAQIGIDVEALPATRRPLCRSCLDWSVRRPHLAGKLGKALLDRIFALEWARQDPGSRVIRFYPRGENAIAKWLVSGR